MSESRALTLSIGGTYQPGMSEEQVYEVGRGNWHAVPTNVSIVLFHVGGEVKGARYLDEWEPSPEPGRNVLTCSADAELSRQYVGLNISSLLARTQNPVQYIPESKLTQLRKEKR